jgi:acetyl-CoA synthetase
VDSPPQEGQLESLKCIVTAGEPLDPELGRWLSGHVRSDGVVADGWGQTELGGIVTLSRTLRGVDSLPRLAFDVVGTDGQPVRKGVKGELVVRAPWPAMFVGTQNDEPEATSWHWERYHGVYATGDRAALEPEGSVVFLGRIDPMVSVSGQLVSLTEVREALLDHPYVREVEIVGRADGQAGQSVSACVALAESMSGSEDVARALREHVRERLGGLAEPRTIAFVDAFPTDVDHTTLQKALRMLCAAAWGDDIYISAGELGAAVAVVRGAAAR